LVAENDKINTGRPDEEDTDQDISRQSSADMGSAAEGAEGGGDLVKQLAEARQQAQENHEKMLRIAAECENLRKRLQRDKETALKYAEENMLKELLPSIDNLERAMEQGRNANDIEVLLEGVEMTRSGLLAALEKFGLKPLKSLGEPFDPNYHEAMIMEPSKDVPEQHIKQVFEKGYFYKDRLIRAAKVVVSKGDVAA